MECMARCYDPDLKLPKQNYFAELSEHMVNQSIPFALAITRNAEGFTPREAVDILLEVSESSSGNHHFDPNPGELINSFVDIYGFRCLTTTIMMATSFATLTG